jgi:ubiquinone/menaquinone biosynthesis C-methylase UbiE
MSEETVTKSTLGSVFDTVTPIVDLVNGGHFHAAYWYGAEDATPIMEAGQRVTRKVADTLGLRPGDHLLDAGCGPGGPAVLVAEETGARVTGISISTYDIAEGRKRAERHGLSDQVGFEHADYMSLPFPDGSFDAIMAIESLLSAPDLAGALREFFRVLRAGGRIALCHCTKEAEMGPEMMERFNTSTMSKALPTLQEWMAAVRDAGFVVEEYSQFGSRVFSQSERYFDAIDERYDQLLTKVDAATVAGLKQGMRGFFAPGPDFVGYAIIAGRKP